jgi:hypothetical protein
MNSLCHIVDDTEPRAVGPNRSIDPSIIRAMGHAMEHLEGAMASCDKIFY